MRTCSARAFRAASAGLLPCVFAPSDTSSTVAGRAGRAAWISASATSSASPIAVGPFADSDGIFPRTASRSLVGRARLVALPENDTAPTRTRGGSWSSRRRSDCRIAESRVGATSAACVLPETSTTSSRISFRPAVRSPMDGCDAASTTPATASHTQAPATRRASRPPTVQSPTRPPGERGNILAQ
jgi:hypothetical protein